MKYKIIITIILFLMSSCDKKITITKKGPEQVLENFRVYESNKGKKIWDLKALRAKIFEQNKNVLVYDFNVNFYNKDGKVTSLLTANQGKIDTELNNFSTEGKTVIKTSDGEILNTTNIKYISKEKKIFTDDKVEIIRKDSVITGEGLEATPDLSVVSIKKNRVVMKK